jgi:hypothetical protein
MHNNLSALKRRNKELKEFNLVKKREQAMIHHWRVEKQKREEEARKRIVEYRQQLRQRVAKAKEDSLMSKH